MCMIAVLKACHCMKYESQLLNTHNEWEVEETQ